MEFILAKLRQIFGLKRPCATNSQDYDSFESFTAYVDSATAAEAKCLSVLSYKESTPAWSGNRPKTPEIPLNIGRFNQLTTLTVTGCGLTNIPWSIVYLKALQKLDLSDNKLMTLPNFISCLESLQVLDLQSNLLVVLPTSLLSLKKLSSIDVKNNETLVGPPYSVCIKGLDRIMQSLSERALRRNLWEDSTAYYSPLESCNAKEVPALIMLAVHCILQSEQDFLMPGYFPPRLKSFLQEKVEEKKTSIQVAKCSVCRTFFSNSFMFESHLCLGTTTRRA